jgi:hypothetical protein
LTANSKIGLIAAVLLSAAAVFTIGHYAGYKKGRTVTEQQMRAGESVKQPSPATDIQPVFVTNDLSPAGATSVDAPSTGADLTPAQATQLAQKLANDHTEALYKCRPFYDFNTPPAQRFGTGWQWRVRCGHRQVDFEGSVTFGRDGRNPTVKVQLLDARADAPFPQRP